MDPFIEYLKSVKSSTNHITAWKDRQIRIVMGNESCDLDSVVSALGLAYVLRQQLPPAVLAVPLLNIPEDEFELRPDNVYVLKQAGIDKNLLVFRNNINLQELQSNNALNVSLVDHHVLRPEDQFLAESVTEVIDHRPEDPNANWDASKTSMLIQQVGSCATLVARKMLDLSDQLQNKTLATLLHYTIVFDTIAFNPEVGKAKELDIEVSDKLSSRFGLRRDSETLFEELWRVHNDVSHLTPRQLLFKDLKVVEGLPVPVLPMTVGKYLKLPNVVEEMTRFCKEKGTSIMVIIGIHVEGRDVERDIAVFDFRNNVSLQGLVVENLKNASELKGYDFGFEQVAVEFPHILYFKQNNIKLTRKHILPLLKDALLQYKANNRL